jgi:folate-dependent tRNA-U54 methylase TrmFO/GidA
MKANFGLLPPLEEQVKPKPKRYQALADRSLSDLREHLQENHEL